MKYYIIAGEASGDLHGSNLIKSIQQIDNQAKFRAWGGDLMKAQGAELVKHYKDHAFMGLFIVIRNIRTINKNFKFCFKDIDTYKPDVLILIDYSGFNLRVADYARKNGLKVFYYISPQIWAWRQGRVKKIKKLIDKMFVILPFEKDFYNKFNCDVEFVGHPLLDAIEQKKDKLPSFKDFRDKNQLPKKPVIAMLPGSRLQEIKQILPIMLQVVNHYTDFQFVIAGSNSIDKNFYSKILDNKNVPVVYNQTYDLLFNAKAALVTSGTATMETALFKIPQVVCYKGGALTYNIVKYLVKVKYISMVNLIMEKMVIKELIQNDLKKENIRTELDKIIHDEAYRSTIISDYNLLGQKLGGPGASSRAAKAMIELLNEKR